METITMSQSEQMILTTPTAPNVSITNFDLPSLHLLHHEIIVILKDAEQHLTDFNNDLAQASLLLDSIRVLQQLSRIFQLIALTGGRVLSQAIAVGLQQLYDSADTDDTDNTALIMDLSEAIMTLDRYVEFVLLTNTIEPSLLLPIINKLHSYGSQQPIDADYFVNFNSSSTVIANPEQNFQALAELNLDSELLTNAYRSGLAVLLSNTDRCISSADKPKITAMSAACKLISSHSSCLFWQAAAAAVSDIESVLPLSLSQKHTLIYLEQQFHSYLPLMDTRFADLVSFACQRDNQLAQSIRQQYALNQLETSQQQQLQRFLFGPNRQITDILNTLIQNQINNIKEQVDDCTRSNALHIGLPAEQLTAISGELLQLRSTLQLLGLTAAAQQLQLAATAVAQWQTPTASDFDHLLLALMGAENAAVTMAKMYTPGTSKLPLNNPNISLQQLDSACEALIQQSRIAILAIEQLIDHYLADGSYDLLKIQPLPDMIHQVAGATRFLQLPISTTMLSQLLRYLQQYLATEQSVDERMLSYVADVMMSVDYTLDGFEHNRPVSKYSLDVGQHSLSQLLTA
jgi:hypothetical protein